MGAWAGGVQTGRFQKIRKQPALMPPLKVHTEPEFSRYIDAPGENRTHRANVTVPTMYVPLGRYKFLETAAAAVNAAVESVTPVLSAP